MFSSSAFQNGINGLLTRQSCETAADGAREGMCVVFTAAQSFTPSAVVSRIGRVKRPLIPFWKAHELKFYIPYHM